MDKFITLLNLKSKKEIESFCKDWVIDSEKLSDFILAGMAGALSPYIHARYHVNLEPEHLHPTKDELKALGNSSVGKAEGKALKAITKAMQMFKQRKLISVHFFFHPSKKYWHIFYFNQRDTTDRNNHWNMGPHIHYTHDTFINATLDQVIEQITKDKPKLPKSIHIKYNKEEHQ